MLEEAIRAYDDHLHSKSSDSAENVVERLNQSLNELATKQTVVARAQINAMMKNLDTLPYEKMLEEINEDRAKFTALLQDAKTQTMKTAQHELKRSVDKFQQVSSATVKSLTASDEDFLPHEKQKLLAVLVDYITPTNDGIEIALRSETLRFIKIAPCVKLN